MNQKEKKSETQLVQVVSSLMSGVILAFGISVLLLFLTAHLVASGTLGEKAAVTAELIASAVGCFCGGIYTALSCRKRMMLLGITVGVIYYAAWTIIGLLCYSDVTALAGIRNLLAAVVGGGIAGFLCAGLRTKRK